MVCREFQYTFSKSVSLKDNIEFLREMLKQLARYGNHSSAESSSRGVPDRSDLL